MNEMTTVALVLCRVLEANEIVFIDGTRSIVGDGLYRLSTAQSIHRNLVKVPLCHFDKVVPYVPFEEYLRGKYAVGIVGDDGAVELKGLKKGVRFLYDDWNGLMIDTPNGEIQP